MLQAQRNPERIKAVDRDGWIALQLLNADKEVFKTVLPEDVIKDHLCHVRVRSYILCACSGYLVGAVAMMRL